jgi:hypothetical protein
MAASRHVAGPPARVLAGYGGGATLAPTTEQLRPVTYAKVAALEEPNTLITIGRQSIQRSSDVGCSWQLLDKHRTT